MLRLQERDNRACNLSKSTTRRLISFSNLTCRAKRRPTRTWARPFAEAESRPQASPHHLPTEKLSAVKMYFWRSRVDARLRICCCRRGSSWLTKQTAPLASETAKDKKSKRRLLISSKVIFSGSSRSYTTRASTATLPSHCWRWRQLPRKRSPHSRRTCTRRQTSPRHTRQISTTSHRSGIC